MNQVESAPAQGFGLLRWIGTILFLILGVPLIWGGIRLVGLGGSPYYVIAGAAAGRHRDPDPAPPRRRAVALCRDPPRHDHLGAWPRSG